MQNEDSSKKIAEEILEVLESHESKGYVISEENYKLLKMKCEMTLKNNFDEQAKSGGYKKIKYERFSKDKIIDEIFDLPRHKRTLILGMAIWWVLFLSYFFASKLNYFISDAIMLILLLSIPAIFGIVYGPYVGAGVGFFSSLPTIIFIRDTGGYFITIIGLTYAGFLPVIILLILSPVFNKFLFDKFPNLKNLFYKYNWIVGFFIAIIINIISNLMANYFQLNFDKFFK